MAFQEKRKVNRPRADFGTMATADEQTENVSKLDQLRQMKGKTAPSAASAISISHFGSGESLSALKKGASALSDEESLRKTIETISLAKQEEAAKELKNKLNLVFIIDRSTSIVKKYLAEGGDGDYSQNAQKIVSGFNNLIAMYRGQNMSVTTCCFTTSDNQIMQYFLENIDNVGGLDYTNSPGSSTCAGSAFYDSAYDTISKVYAEIARKKQTGPTLVVMLSDQDIYLPKWEKSVRHSGSDLANLIGQTGREGFHYMFIAANGLDEKLCKAVEDLGVSAKHTIKSNANNVDKKIESVSDAINQLLANKNQEIKVKNNLAEIVEAKRLMLEGQR